MLQSMTVEFYKNEDKIIKKAIDLTLCKKNCFRSWELALVCNFCFLLQNLF